MSPPVFDPDLPRPERTDPSRGTVRPPAPTFYEAITAGIKRIKCPKRLRQYGADWAQEIKDSGRRDEITEKYKQRMKELTRR